MKFAMALLVTTIAATSTFAAETVCLNAKLTENSRPGMSCGDVAKICVKGFQQDDNARVDEKIKADSLVLTDKEGRSLQMASTGSTVDHDSDVDTHLGLSFSSQKISAYLEIETAYMDYDSRGEIIGTFINMELYRAYKGANDVEVQRCEYALSK